MIASIGNTISANMDSLTTFLPVQASLSNYAEVFSRLNMPLVFKNTLLYIALILVLDLLVNSMCGYALAKFEFKGKGAVLNLVIALMVLPLLQSGHPEHHRRTAGTYKLRSILQQKE